MNYSLYIIYKMQYVTHATITNHYLPWYLEIADIHMEYNISDLRNNACGIALCRDPSTHHLDGKEITKYGWTGKIEGAKKVFQNHRYC